MASGFLTTQQVQDLLEVDASTIYRMAGDGRLPAVRIGRQWRFPASDIHAMLRAGGTDTARTGPLPAGSEGASPAVPGAAPLVPSAPVATPQPPHPEVLPPALAAAALEAIAPALGVAMVVTDLDGRPLTPIVNPARAIVARSQDPDFAAACSLEWRAFAHEPHLAPRLAPGRFGFLCAHSFVRSGPTLVAMVLAGGIASPGDTDPDLHHLDERGHRLVLETLPRTAALLSQLVAMTSASSPTATRTTASPPAGHAGPPPDATPAPTTSTDA